MFLIGARFSMRHPIQSFNDLGGLKRGMRQMLDYLVAHPDKGLLGYEMGLKTIVQYWRSFELLEAFAKDKGDPHLQVWRDYWKRVGKSTRSGIWHETFLVRAGEYEAIYGNMPAYGLGKASGSCRSPRAARPASASGAPRRGSRRAPRRVSAARCGLVFDVPLWWRRLRSRPVAEAAPPRERPRSICPWHRTCPTSGSR